jgi:hypothetical protein
MSKSMIATPPLAAQERIAPPRKGTLRQDPNGAEASPPVRQGEPTGQSGRRAVMGGTRRAPGGDVGREQSDRPEKGECRSESQRVRGRDAVKLAPQQSAEDEGRNGSDDDAGAAELYSRAS